MKRIFAVTGLVMAVGLGVFIYGGWQMFGDEIRAIRTLKMIQDRVYTFEYKGHYAIVRTIPDDGYASVSTTCFSFLGMGEDWHPVV